MPAPSTGRKGMASRDPAPALCAVLGGLWPRGSRAGQLQLLALVVLYLAFLLQQLQGLGAALDPGADTTCGACGLRPRGSRARMRCGLRRGSNGLTCQVTSPATPARRLSLRDRRAKEKPRFHRNLGFGTTAPIEANPVVQSKANASFFQGIVKRVLSCITRKISTSTNAAIRRVQTNIDNTREFDLPTSRGESRWIRFLLAIQKSCVVTPARNQRITEQCTTTQQKRSVIQNLDFKVLLTSLFVDDKVSFEMIRPSNMTFHVWIRDMRVYCIGRNTREQLKRNSTIQVQHFITPVKELPGWSSTPTSSRVIDRPRGSLTICNIASQAIFRGGTG